MLRSALCLRAIMRALRDVYCAHMEKVDAGSAHALMMLREKRRRHAAWRERHDSYCQLFMPPGCAMRFMLF